MTKNNWIKKGELFELYYNKTVVATLRQINTSDWIVSSNFGFDYKIHNNGKIKTVLLNAEMIIATNIFLKYCYYTSLTSVFDNPKANKNKSLYWFESELGYKLRFYNEEIKETSMIACVNWINNYYTYSSSVLGVCSTIIFNDNLDYVKQLIMHKIEKCCRTKSLLFANIYCNCFSEKVKSRLVDKLFQ